MKKEYCVYVHTNKTNGKRYVGITRRDVKERWRKGSTYRYNDHFYRSIMKYGWDGFEHEVLFTGLTKAEADEMERYLIRLWECTDSNKGYNIALGGDGHESYSPQTRRKMSESAKLRNKDPEKFNRICEGNRKRWLSETEHKKIRDGLNRYYQNNPDRRNEISEERKRFFSDHPEKKKTRAVVQISKNGEVIRVWESMTTAGKQLQINAHNISAVCNGRRLYAGGYIWRYSDEIQDKAI